MLEYFKQVYGNPPVYIQENGLDVKVEVIAIEDKFIEHGNVNELRSQIGITSEDILNKVKEYLA